MKETRPIVVSEETHDLVRRIAYEQRTTMREVTEEAVWSVYKGHPSALIDQYHQTKKENRLR